VAVADFFSALPIMVQLGLLTFSFWSPLDELETYIIS
jgi:hypothetical protein